MQWTFLFHYIVVPMTYKEATIHIIQSLQYVYEKREAANIAELVMEKLTGMKRLDRLIAKEPMLIADKILLLHGYIEQLTANLPVQYVLEEAWFYGMALYVNPQVLIPRPETEELVDWIVKEQANSTAPLKILDIGTGSGCIPLALKKSIPAADIWAIDISDKALEVAQRNARQQHLEINFKQLDVLNEDRYDEIPTFDIIVSNPPYIPAGERATMANHVTQHEPHLALFVPDQDPLLFYRAIGKLAAKALAPNGVIYLELHENLANETAALFHTFGLTQTTVKNDMQQKERMLKVYNGPISEMT